MNRENLTDIITHIPPDYYKGSSWAFGDWMRGPRRKPLTEEEKLARATKRIRKKTTLGKLEQLEADRIVWARKQTVATRKLAQINAAIAATAKALAQEKFDHELSSKS